MIFALIALIVHGIDCLGAFSMRVRAGLRLFCSLVITVLQILVITGGTAAGVEDFSGELEILPSEIELSDSKDVHRLLLIRRLPDGSTEDLTSKAKWQTDDSSVAVVDGSLVSPTGDGITWVSAEIEQDMAATSPNARATDGNRIQVRAKVTVRNSTAVTDLSFRCDVLAVLTKAGCNSGKCHGSASGKDGFRLSLYGFDPPGDHYRLTREMNGRRVNVVDPESSLLIQKALGNVDHTGGGPIVADTPHYHVLIDWIRSGAKGDSSSNPIPTGIRVLPDAAVFAQSGQDQQMIVLAEFSDGTSRDVTDRAVFISNNDAAASVSGEGVIHGNGHGSAFIMARFDQYTEGTSVIVRPGTPFEFPAITAENLVDELVFARWKELHLMPSDLCSDEVFMRRLYLDLTGLLPTPEEQAKFLNDPSTDRREKLVDELLKRTEFTDLWVMKWAEMFQIRTTNGVSPKGLLLYDRWLRDRVYSGATINQIVRELLPATGGTFDNPASAYYQTETTPQLLAENIAQSMMGTRIQCAQCHNHPFDRWTMDDYYGFAAFFSQVGYKQARDPREIMVFDLGEGELKHPVPNREVIPMFLGSGIPEIPEGVDYRQVIGDWLVSDDNPAFARNIANVVWAHFFGIGIVEPVDDMRVSNPPSNPALLQALAQELKASEYDIRPLVRLICTSRTYQLETRRNQFNQFDERHFSHGRIRRLRAEVLLDAISQVTETSNEFRGLPAGSRAVHIPDGQTPNYFLTTFGRSTRNTSCSCEVRTSPTLSQALHLLNGESTTGKILEGQVITMLLNESNDPLNVAEQLYQRCLCRKLSDDERTAIAARLNASSTPVQELEDLFWAILNSNEFIFNH